MDSTETKYYRYHGAGHIMRSFIAWGITLLCLTLSLVFAGGILTADWHGIDKAEITPQAVCDALAFLLGMPLGALTGLAIANMFPTVGISSHHLVVSFCFREFKIPWEDVIEITRVWYPVVKPLYVVKVKRLTPFHSVFYGSSARFLSFRPAFLLSPDIDDFDELLSNLKSKLEDL